MRTILVTMFSFFLIHISSAAMEWKDGVITTAGWYDQGGFHVEIDGTTYLFMTDASITEYSDTCSVSSRLTYLTPDTKVYFLYDGLRIYSLEIKWRSR